MLGIDSPDKAIGKIILSDGKKEIIGVIEDYHHLSLKENIQPIIFHNDFNNPSFYTIKLNNNDFHNNISILHNVWKKIYPYSPFEYFILEDFYNNQYLAEINFNNIFKVFTILSIIIACLGLFALSYYDISLRTKEICIRKILGSSILGLFSLLSKSTIKICVCSLIIAWAIGYYFVNTWLQNFAFHINISILVFVFSGMIILIINILTISYNVLRIANINPARIIKDE
jgi:putative ABC transport system permease protein